MVEINSQLRGRLSGRVAELNDRIRCVELDAAKLGYGCGGMLDQEKGLASNPILEHALAPVRRELAQARGSLRRLERREADCCMHCGSDISLDELEASPYAVSCAACAKTFLLSNEVDLRVQNDSLCSMVLQLCDLVAQVRSKLCDGVRAELESGAFIALLEDFGRELQKHFTAEEKNGYMADALKAAPRYGREADRLGGQHVSLSKQISAVHGIFDAIAVPADWSTVQHDLQQFTTDLFEHEGAENQVLQSAFLDDLGGG
jgi:RNA polymerase-binding transcription factor DksA